MAWIESHQALGHHPKTQRLATALGVRVPEAVGLVHFLWWWALDYAPEGLVPATDKTVIARTCMWHGKPEKFWEGLMVAGFVEQVGEDALKIHDWMDYAGRLIQKRAANVERVRRARNANATHSESETNAHVTGLPTVPYQPYQPDQPTGPDQPNPPNPPSDPPKGGDGLETCPECEMPVDAKGEGHGLTRQPGRIRNCSLDHLAPYEWPVEVGVS